MTTPDLASADDQPVGAPFADGIVPMSLERRTASLVILGACILFLLALAIAPTNNPTYDDAKYVGIGRNVLDGRGPLNVFGTIFLKHAPVWPVLIVLPERIAEISPIAVGHVINGMSGVAIILLVGALGWRVRPALGALGAIVLLGQTVFLDIGRTAGIDLPATAITLGYVLLGFVAVRRQSLWLAALAGLLFGLGFLIKETILPFAPVPFVAAILWGVRWPSILRLSAMTLATAALSTSWWFAMYAWHTGDVYRVGFPAWTLAPAAMAILLFVVLALAAETIARRLGPTGRDARLASRLPDWARMHGRSIAGWILTIAWLLVLVWIFNGTSKLQGGGLLNAAQIRSYLSTTFVPMIPVFAFGLGSILAVVTLIRDPAAMGGEARALLITAVCGIPLVMLVIGVGEAARHYIGVVAMLGLVASMGWIAGGYEAFFRRDRLLIALLIGIGAIATVLVGVRLLRHVTRTWLIAGAAGTVIALVVGVIVAVWLSRRGQIRSVGPLLLVVALLLPAAGLTLRHSSQLSGTIDMVETGATNRVNEWISDNVSLDSVVGIGPYLSMETAMNLPPGYQAVMIRHALAIGDPSAPLGLRGGAPKSDWIAVDVAPNKANQFLVYAADRFTSLIEKNRPAVYVYNLRRDRSAISVLNALRPDHGFEEVASWSYPIGSDVIETHIFNIDYDGFAMDPREMFISPEALDRLARILEREPDDGSRAAAALLSRIVRPPDGSLDAGLTRLEILAERRG